MLIFTGYYFFYLEYNKLVKFDNLYFENKEPANKIVIENKKLNSDDLNPIKSDNLSQKKKNEIVVAKGDTFFSILKRFNLLESKIFQIINETEKYYDLRKLKVNNKIIFYEDLNKEIVKISISVDFDKALIINIDNDNIYIEEKYLEKESYKLSQEFLIIDSLYSDGIKNNLPQDILIKLIKLFSFDLDFQRDIRENTKVSVSYNVSQIKENQNIIYNDIDYALISIDGKELEYFKFLTNDGFIDYYNREGKNVKKSILKTPLDGARLSSSFGMRKHPISGYNKMHKGVDFAAPKGTPVYAGGNGVIEFMGKNGGYGNYIRIRHNNEYKTAYAHLSGYKKGISKGSRVNQGDIIGFVGSTGNSTGPHLHYEIIFQNKQINPLKLKLPSGKILKGKELEKFKIEYKKIYANHLNLLYE